MLVQSKDIFPIKQYADSSNSFLMGMLTTFYFALCTYAVKNNEWLSLLPFFFLALWSRKGTIIALMACWLPGNLGGALLHLPGAGFISFSLFELPAHRRLLALWCLGISLCRPRRASSGDNFDYPTVLIFVFVISCASIFSSELPKISIMRIFMWFLDIMAIQKSLTQLDRGDFSWVINFFLAIIIASAGLSLALMFQPGSQLGGKFLKGIYTNSQYLAAISASAASFFLTLLLFRNNNLKSFSCLAAISTILVLTIFFGHSRTAIISIILAIITALLWSNRFGKIDTKIVVLSFIFIILLGLATAINDPNYFDPIIYKYKTTSLDDEGSFTARKEFIENGMTIFRQSILLGNGFGMPAWPESYFDSARVQSNILGNPNFQKASEKGFLPAAVLQEIGLLGFFLFLLLTISILRRMDRTNTALLAAALTGLFSNIADNTFFMPSFIGFYHWIWILLSINSRP